MTAPLARFAPPRTSTALALAGVRSSDFVPHLGAVLDGVEAALRAGTAPEDIVGIVAPEGVLFTGHRARLAAELRDLDGLRALIRRSGVRAGCILAVFVGDEPLAIHMPVSRVLAGDFSQGCPARSRDVSRFLVGGLRRCIANRLLVGGRR